MASALASYMPVNLRFRAMWHCPSTLMGNATLLCLREAMPHCSKRSDGEDALDELLELAGVTALDHRQHVAIVHRRGVARAPVLPGLRVEPVGVPGLAHDRVECRQRLSAVVVACVAQDQQRALRRDRVGPALREHVEGVAVVTVSVEPHDVGLLRHSRERIDDVTAALEERRDLVAGVDEREHPDLRELLPKGEGQQHREVREGRHTSTDVAEDDKLRFVRLARLEDGRERNAAARQRRPDRTTDIEPAAATVPSLGGQPGGEPPGERVNTAAQLGDLVARGTQEVDLLDQWLHGGLGDLLHATVFRESTAYLGLDGLFELPD